MRGIGYRRRDDFAVAHDWVAAQAAQEAAIASGGGGEAYQELATALFWQNKVDDALRALEVELDHYLRAGEETVHVIHGHGSGALKQAVREHLRRSGYVAQVRAGEQHEGGDAVSVVTLRG